MTMGSCIKRTALSVLAAAFAAGCTTLSGIIADQAVDDSASQVAATWWDGPRVRPGVALVIQIGNSAEAPIVVNALVDQNGDLTIPLLLQRPVACDGLTLEALKQKLVKEYSVYYRQPQISVTFAPFDNSRGGAVSPWGTVTVLGEVVSPGPVNMPSTMELPVTKALQMSGGVKPYANRSAIQVTRCDKDGRQRRFKIDLKEIGEDGRVDKDMLLRAGDVVWVPETWY